jgi:3-methyladenine DNA glycosylase AlkD
MPPVTRKEYAKQIIAVLRDLGDGKRALSAKAYMRNQFEFFGVSSPERKLALKLFVKQFGLLPKTQIHELVKTLWKQPQRELHYCALELAYLYKKEFDENDLAFFETLIVSNSWWDSVDYIAPKLCAAYFLKHPKELAEVTKRWNKSENIWLIRSSIIVQLLHKTKTNEAVLFENITRQTKHPDFFVRKAIGWALRQYARTNAKAVLAFVAETEMSALSRKEAMKYLNK